MYGSIGKIPMYRCTWYVKIFHFEIGCHPNSSSTKQNQNCLLLIDAYDNGGRVSARFLEEHLPCEAPSL